VAARSRLRREGQPALDLYERRLQGRALSILPDNVGRSRLRAVDAASTLRPLMLTQRLIWRVRDSELQLDSKMNNLDIPDEQSSLGLKENGLGTDTANVATLVGDIVSNNSADFQNFGGKAGLADKLTDPRLCDGHRSTRLRSVGACWGESSRRHVRIGTTQAVRRRRGKVSSSTRTTPIPWPWRRVGDMMRRQTIAAGVLLTLAAGVLPAATAGSAPGPRGCGPVRGTRTLAVNRFGRLLAAKDQTGTTDLAVCVAGGQALYIADNGIPVESQIDHFSVPRLAGPFVAVAETQDDTTTPPPPGWSIQLYDLRPPIVRGNQQVAPIHLHLVGNPRLVKSVGAASELDPDNPVRALVLTPGGTVALLTANVTSHTREVRVLDRHGTLKILDTGHRLPANRFVLRGGTLSWVNDGRRRSVQLA